MSACRLRLNAAKTQLLWLGSSQLVDRVDCHDVLVLGTRVAISDTARDLGVVILLLLLLLLYFIPQVV